MDKLALFRLIGELFAKPDKFKEECQVISMKDEGDHLFVALRLSGALAGTVRGFKPKADNVERSVEEKENPAAGTGR